MSTFLLLNRLWTIYSEVVHQTLFFEILSHNVPVGLVLLLSTAADFIEEHGTVVILFAAIMVSLFKTVWQARKQESQRRGRGKVRHKEPYARDSQGRFVKRNQKRS